jgi:thiol-disulfide isomerase/thioredoxin
VPKAAARVRAPTDADTTGRKEPTVPKPSSRVLIAGLAATLAVPALAGPGHDGHSHATITVEPVRDPGSAEAIIDAERENLPKPTLNIGMKAPDLAIAEWVKGDSVGSFEGKTNVVEFWATWCGPCIRAFPHLSELQKEHAEDLRIIGVNIWDRQRDRETREYSESMPELIERVEQFVEGQGDKMGYTVAIEQTDKMAENWMRAAGRNGIPSAFIVDGEGTVAWIGHPMAMDEPLEQIMAGEWDYETAASEYVTGLEEGYWYQHLMGLLSNADTAERGYKLGYALLRTPLAENPAMLNAVSWNILTSDRIPVRDLDMAIAVAAVACEQTAWEDASIIDTLARGHFDKGDVAKAVELQGRAVAAAGDSPMAADLKQTLERYRAAAKE